ncbi:class F sortase [Streptomyces ruber]|uniref:Class F sortase n=2 Tax=Streptomyces TaxID=1883 RepID=A0A918BHG3_9ACTN|nr:class F sortase [Streptomyces ruber]GGQ67702.1 class F sortase [Streptomyces ruber]
MFRTTRTTSVALVCAALVALAGCSSSPTADSTAAPQHTPNRQRTEPAGPTAPTHVTIPSLGISSPIMELGLNEDRTVEVPPADQGMTTGWYTGSSVPGEPGAAVLIGHNETRFGEAVFWDLKKIRKGADIAVEGGDGTKAHFTVTATETVRKDAFPSQKVYGPTGDRALRLITCDGAFDAEGHTVDNLIVYATLSA